MPFKNISKEVLNRQSFSDINLYFQFFIFVNDNNEEVLKEKTKS